MKTMLPEWVTRTALCRPESVAICGEDETLTYEELELFSNRLAVVLREHGCRRGDRIAILMPTSARAVASLIGVLKAGCCYVPLDTTGGLARTADVLRQCEPAVVLADESQRTPLAKLRCRGAVGRASTGWLGEDPLPDGAAFGRKDIDAVAGKTVPLQGVPEDLAYIMFTSGTTGAPKGVPITHANVRTFIDWVVRYFQLGPEDRLSGHTALTFDLSTFDIFATLASGASLHHVPRAARLLPHKLTEFIEDRALTLWFSVPSQLAYVARFDALEGRSLSSLRHVAWCGDVLSTPSLLYWKRRLPQAAFTNLYGPTETTVASSYYRVPDDYDDPTRPIPIGQACPGEALAVLDDDLRPVPRGEAGEIYIRGAGLSPGYWRDVERTRIAFLTDPPAANGSGTLYRTGDRGFVGADGMLRFLGRNDLQIKTSGYRVEPAEVENAILLLDEVEACAVFPIEADDFNGATIGCAYVPANGRPLHTRSIKKRLAESIPPYMIPASWLRLDDLPVDSRGKIDRARARAMMGG